MRERFSCSFTAGKSGNVLRRVGHDLEQIDLLQQRVHSVGVNRECVTRLAQPAQPVDHLVALGEFLDWFAPYKLHGKVSVPRFAPGSYARMFRQFDLSVHAMQRDCTTRWGSLRG